MTNRQRIETMTDAELAQFLFDRGNGSEYCYGICACQDECCGSYHSDEFCISQIVKWLNREGDEGMSEYKEGQYIIYQNESRFEIGKIKRLTPTGAFVWYSSGDTAAKTPYDCMHPLENEYVIEKTNLGGDSA